MFTMFFMALHFAIKSAFYYSYKGKSLFTLAVYQIFAKIFPSA